MLHPSASSSSLVISVASASDPPLAANEARVKQSSCWNRLSKVLVITGVVSTITGLAIGVGIIAKLTTKLVSAETNLEGQDHDYYLHTDAGLTNMGRLAIGGLGTFAGGVVFVVAGTAAALIDFNNKRE